MAILRTADRGLTNTIKLYELPAPPKATPAASSVLGGEKYELRGEGKAIKKQYIRKKVFVVNIPNTDSVELTHE